MKTRSLTCKEDKMNTYTLTATLNHNTNRKTIHAADEAGAMFQAISHIMDKAHKTKESAWAIGYIKLVDSQGNLLAEMDKK